MEVSTLNWITIVSALANVGIGLVVLLHRKNSTAHRAFFFFTLGAMFWALGFIFLLHTGDFIFDKFILYGALLGVGSLYLFSKYFPLKFYEVQRVSALYKTIPLLFVAIILPFNLVIKSASIVDGVIAPNNGPLFPVFVAILCAYLIATIFNLYKSFKKADPLERNKILYFFCGLFVLILGSLIFSLLLPAFGVFHLNVLGPVLVSIFVLLTAYSLVARNLLDIRLVAQKTLIYSIIISLVSFLYVVLIFFLEYFVFEQTATLLGSLAVIFLGLATIPQIDIYLKKITNPWFYKQDYDYTQSLKELNKKLSDLTNIDEFINLIRLDLKRIFQSTAVRVLSSSKYCSALSKDVLFSVRRDVLYVPVISRGVFVATLHCASKKSGDLYNKKDADLLAIFSYHLGSKFRQLQLISELKTHSQNLEGELVTSQEGQARLLDDQNRMVVDIAHNLQTPLTILKSEIDSLQTAQDSLQGKDLEQLDVSIDALSQFITRLLQSADTRDSQYQMKIFDLSLLMEGICEYLQTVAEAQDIDFGYMIEPEVQMKGDIKAVEEAVVNLVSNAFKYRRKGSDHRVHLELSLDGLVKIDVQDNGIGIETERIGHIFNRWYQIDSTQRGSGLGLSIVKNIAEKHSGKVSVSSHIEEGSCFTLTFPSL